MLGGSKKIQKEKKYSSFKAIESVHPHKMILYLVLFGSFLILGFMIFGFVFSIQKVNSSIALDLPKIFTVGIVVLLFSNINVNKFNDLFAHDKLNKLKDQLAISLSLTLIFSICQYIGWHELSKLNFIQQQDGPNSFLIVISIFHCLHIGLGIFMLTFYLIKTWRMLQDPVKRLITMTNPYETVKLEIFTIFWRVMNFYWISIFLVLLFLF